MPARAEDDPKHELGIWLPLALADIYTLMAANAGSKHVPTVSDVLAGWQLGNLAKAISSPTKTVPHKRGGIYGRELASMFSKELM